MVYLIDTQIAIWALINPEKISATNQKRMEKAKVLVSQISLFEIAIKQKIGKLPHLNIPVSRLVSVFEHDGFEILPIKNQHIENYSTIPLFEEHRDPFDRLILATAFYEKLPLISADGKHSLYDSLIEIIKN